MRNIIGVEKKQQISLETQFPKLLSLVEGEQPEEYIYLAVSLFDHWLNDEESMEHLHMTERKEQERRNHMFDHFNKLIIESTEVLTFRFKGRNKITPSFKKFTSLSAKYNSMVHSDMGEYKVVLPEFGAAYFEGYDDTNIFFLSDLSLKSIIELWAKKTGLYCLDRPVT
jgi:hypothetical protein